MATNKIPQGGDARIVCTVTDQDGDAFDLTGALEIELAVYQNTGAILARLRLSDSRVSVTNAAGGIFEAYLDRSVTERAEPGVIFGEIAVEKTNASFESSKQRIVSTAKRIGEIVTGVMNEDR